jgi:hypothetical protein
MWKVYLRKHESGGISERLATSSVSDGTAEATAWEPALAMSRAMLKVARETGDKALAKEAAALACTATQRKACFDYGR